MKKDIVAIIIASIFCLFCVVMGYKQGLVKNAPIPEVVTEALPEPVIEHGVNCDCDSLFGYKLCDTLNFGGVTFYGDKHPSGAYYNIFFFERTPITNTPYAIRLYAQTDNNWRKIEKCLTDNIKNFNWIPWHPDENWKTIELPKRFKKYIVNDNYSWAIGTQNGKEYFTSWCSFFNSNNEYIHCERNVIITDLNLLKLYEKEQYDSEVPERERVAREKAEAEKNAQIFPI